jgi:hypothetical protein
MQQIELEFHAVNLHGGKYSEFKDSSYWSASYF